MPSVAIRQSLKCDAFIGMASISLRKVCHCTPMYRQTARVESTEVHSGKAE